MKNITEYNDFKNIKNIEKMNEGAQLIDSDWSVRTRVTIPTSLINAYVKKVQSECGEDPRKKWSEQEIAEELTKYATTAFLTVENLPTSIISSGSKQPVVQSQEDMPVETQVESPVQEPAQEVPTEGQPAAQTPAQPAAQGAQSIAQEVPQTQTQAPAQI